MHSFVLILLSTFMQQSSFKEAQLKHERVKAAYEEKEGVVKDIFATRNLAYTGFNLFIRAFKEEEVLEVWVRERGKDKFSLLTTYRFCTSSGGLGPKRREGDLQIPEGVYHVNHFNPLSNFHLSLGVSYPNSADRILSDPEKPGGSIYIHGSCVTIGCIPITDEKIKELYVMAVEARNNGQSRIPIHIFPARLTDVKMSELKEKYAAAPSVITFWENLKPLYHDFENDNKVKSVKVNQRGEYYF